MNRWLASALGMALMAAPSPFAFRTSTLPFVHRPSPTSQKYLPETMGGGVALLDYNLDGRLDIFLVNGGQMGADFRRREPAYWNRLYRQEPNGSFTDVTLAAGLSTSPNFYGMGVATGDIDNDGDPDLYITGYGGTCLYRNRGNGTFELTQEAPAPGWSVSAAFLDYDLDGHLDLFVARYLDWDLSRNILCGAPFHAYCRPDKFTGTSNLLFHNDGHGHFRDVTADSGIGAAIGKGMGVAVNDYDQDGFPDVFVANDGMEQFLFHNQRNGTFRECALEVGVALSDDARTYAGMGVAFADFDNDGHPDLAVTNLALEKYALYRNEGGHFAYASLTSGLAALTARSSGWGVGLHDFDNNGFKDLFAAQGHVLDNVEKIQPGLRYREPPALYLNEGGRFRAANLPLAAVAGRGAAFGDLDNDGTLDTVVAVLGGAPIILHGQASQPGITLEINGTRANRDGIGAIVQEGNQTVYATTAGSYLSANDRRVHLAGSPTEVTITWPGGRKQLEKLPRARFVRIPEKP